MGGGNIPLPELFAHSRGLSPRGRGKPAALRTLTLPMRSIPAWAGETRAAGFPPIPAAPPSGSIPAWAGETGCGNCWRPRTAVYPRVGGGNPYADLPADVPGGSIPAWAGETPGAKAPRSAAKVYPRVGGGTPPGNAAAEEINGLSPRGRGKRDLPPDALGGSGSIPAWAGETPAMPLRFGKPAVYPRVGGGNGFPLGR